MGDSQTRLYEQVSCLPITLWSLIRSAEWRITAKSYSVPRSGQRRQRAWLVVAALFTLHGAVTGAPALRGRQMRLAMLLCDFLSNLLKKCWKNKL